MGGTPSQGTPADMRLTENQVRSSGGATPPSLPDDMPQMTHQLVAPPATCIEPGEMGEPQWNGAGN